MSDFASTFQAALASQAPASEASAPVDATPEVQGAPEQFGGQDGDLAPQQTDEQPQEGQEDQGEEQQENQRGDLNKALASERYKARQAKEEAKALKAEVESMRAQASQVQQLQQQMQELQAQKQEAVKANALADAQALAREYMDNGDAEAAMQVMHNYAKAESEAAHRAAAEQARGYQARAAQAEALSFIRSEGARLEAQHGATYQEAISWANGPESPLAPILDQVGLALMNGTISPEGFYQLASTLKRGASANEQAIEAEVNRRLAAAQVNGATPQGSRTPRLGALPGGVGNVTPNAAQRGNPEALQNVQRGSGFGTYFTAARQAQG